MKTMHHRIRAARGLALALLAAAAVGAPPGDASAGAYVIASMPQGGKFYYDPAQQTLFKDGALIYIPAPQWFEGLCALLVRKGIPDIQSKGLSVNDVAQMGCWRTTKGLN